MFHKGERHGSGTSHRSNGSVGKSMNLLALFLFMLSSLSMFSIVDGGGVELAEDSAKYHHPKIEFIQSTSLKSHGRRLDPAESASTSETARIA